MGHTHGCDEVQQQDAKVGQAVSRLAKQRAGVRRNVAKECDNTLLLLSDARQGAARSVSGGRCFTKRNGRVGAPKESAIMPPTSIETR
jgi:hypothetical protein